MTVVATMLSGNSEKIVAEAVRSVAAWVDLFVLIDTGITDQTVQIVQEQAGDKFRTVQFPWCQDFARARNFSLEQAAAHGGTWALTIDTDERLSFPGFESREALRDRLHSVPEVLLWLVAKQEGT